MAFVALQDFEHFGETYSAGDALPLRARHWLDLRKLQRRGLVSLTQRPEQEPPRVATPARAETPPPDPGDDDQDEDEEQEEIAPKRRAPRKKRAA